MSYNGETYPQEDLQNMVFTFSENFTTMSSTLQGNTRSYKLTRWRDYWRIEQWVTLFNKRKVVTDRGLLKLEGNTLTIAYGPFYGGTEELLFPIDFSGSVEGYDVDIFVYERKPTPGPD